ncbi:MAG: hypothetical protein ABI460_08050 [Caldimonas sp.]
MSHLSNSCALVSACVLLATAASAPSANAADACDVLYNAGIKSVQTPHHVYSNRTMPKGQPKASEAIFADGVEYLRRNGTWIRSPMPQAAMVAAAQEKLKTHPDTCTPMGDQVVGGQAVNVYKAHNKDVDTDQTVRIFKSSGLMQGGTLTLPDGSTLETRYEYDNVQAPTLAK